MVCTGVSSSCPKEASSAQRCCISLHCALELYQIRGRLGIGSEDSGACFGTVCSRDLGAEVQVVLVCPHLAVELCLPDPLSLPLLFCCHLQMLGPFSASTVTTPWQSAFPSLASLFRCLLDRLCLLTRNRLNWNEIIYKSHGRIWILAVHFLPRSQAAVNTDLKDYTVLLVLSSPCFLFPSSFPSLLSWTYRMSPFSHVFFLSLCSFHSPSPFHPFSLCFPFCLFASLISCILFFLLLYSPSIFKPRQNQIIYEGL